MVVSRRSGAPQAATSRPSLFPLTARTGAYPASSSSTRAVHTSPACRIRPALAQARRPPRAGRYSSGGVHACPRAPPPSPPRFFRAEPWRKPRPTADRAGRWSLCMSRRCPGRSLPVTVAACLTGSRAWTSGAPPWWSPTRTRCTSPIPGTPSWTWSATTWPWRRARCAASAGRPMALKRFVNGVDGEPFFQKRAPGQPAGVDRDGRAQLPVRAARADEVVVRDAAALAWVVNLGCIDLNPHPVRADDLDHPDELRVDLDPVPGRAVARRCATWPWWSGDVLTDYGLTGWPKTSGSRGIHIYARIEPRWTFARGAPRRAGPGPRGRAARPRARHQQVVEGGAARRLPRLQPERQGPHGRLRLFGPARLPDARVSTPLAWEEVPRLRPGGVHLGTVPGAVRGARRPVGRHRRGGRLAGRRCSSWPRARGGRAGDAPWPPHYASRRASRPACSRRERRQPGSGRLRPGGAAPAQDAADRDRPGARPRTRRWPGWSAGRRGTRRSWAARRRPTCWSTRCGGAAPRGTGSGSTCGTSPRPSGPPQEPLEVDYDPWTQG